MKTSNLKRSTGPLLAFAMIFTMSFAAVGPSQAAGVDPAATTILKKMARAVQCTYPEYTRGCARFRAAGGSGRIGKRGHQ